MRKLIQSQLKAPTRLTALQVFNLLRYSTILLVAIAVSHLAGDISVINRYETLMMIGGAFTFFFVSGINQAFYAGYHRREESERNGYILSAMVLFCLSSVVAVVGSSLYIHFKIPPEHQLTFVLFLAYMVMNTPAFFTEYVLLVGGHSKGLIRYGIITSAAFAACIVLPFLFDGSLFHVVIALIILAFCKLVYLIRILPQGKAIERSSFVELLKQSLPIMISLLIGGGYLYLSQFLSKEWFTEQSFTWYRYGAREFPLFLIVINSLSTIYSGRNEDRSIDIGGLKKQIDRFIWMFGILAVLLMVSSEWVFHLILDVKVAASYRVFNIFLFLLPVRLLMPQTVLLAMGRSKYFMASSVIELLVGVSAAYILVGPGGNVEWMAWTVVLSYLAEKLVLIAALWKEGVRPNHYLSIDKWLILVAILTSIYWFLSL